MQKLICGNLDPRHKAEILYHNAYTRLFVVLYSMIFVFEEWYILRISHLRILQMWLQWRVMDCGIYQMIMWKSLRSKVMMMQSFLFLGKMSLKIAYVCGGNIL